MLSNYDLKKNKKKPYNKNQSTSNKDNFTEITFQDNEPKVDTFQADNDKRDNQYIRGRPQERGRQEKNKREYIVEDINKLSPRNKEPIGSCTRQDVKPRNHDNNNNDRSNKQLQENGMTSDQNLTKNYEEDPIVIDKLMLNGEQHMENHVTKSNSRIFTHCNITQTVDNNDTITFTISIDNDVYDKKISITDKMLLKETIDDLVMTL